MRSSFLGLEVSKRSIQISQKALDITNNNLSNANVGGYTRQRVDTNSMYLNSFSYWQTNTSRLSLAGQGVNAFGVSQIRDPYLDKRYRDMTCYVAEYDKKAAVMGEVQTTLDIVENTNGLEALLTNDFKNALSQYATNAADNKELASNFRNEAYNITTLLNTYSTELNRLMETNKFELEETVSYTNLLVEKITAYNSAILGEYKATEFDNIVNGESVSQYGPLELMDAQNLLIDELSYYGNIEVTHNHDGTVNVAMGGQTLVNGTKHEMLYMNDFDDYGAAQIKVTGGEQLRLQSGEIKAYVDIVNGNGPYASSYQNAEYGIPYYISSINAFAEGFADLMNTANGCSIDDTSRAMFGSTDDKYDDDGFLIERGSITAANICISKEWLANETMVGQVQNKETGAWEYDADLDGQHANELLLALETPYRFGNSNDFTGAPDEFVLFYSNRMWQDLSFCDSQFEAAFTTTNTLLDSRDAVAGVSDTEEGINMLNYQKWFNASSRMMTALDECLDRVINNMGRCGL